MWPCWTNLGRHCHLSSQDDEPPSRMISGSHHLSLVARKGAAPTRGVESTAWLVGVGCLLESMAAGAACCGSLPHERVVLDGPKDFHGHVDFCCLVDWRQRRLC